MLSGAKLPPKHVVGKEEFSLTHGSGYFRWAGSHPPVSFHGGPCL
jgi:hypothetical protein